MQTNAKTSLLAGQTQKVSLAAKTAGGSTSSVVGVPQWSADAGGATVEADPDGLSATITAGADAGKTNITVTAEGDAVAGTDPLELVIEVDVTLPEATQLTATFGDAVGAGE
jgi:hypothetical protein